jgi:hypothetical protein
VTDGYKALSGKLTAILHIGAGDLHVRRDLLGSILETEHAGKKVRVELPGSNGRFRVHPSPLQAVRGSRGRQGDPAALSIVQLVQVQVNLGRGLGKEGSGNAEYVLLEEAAPIAQAVVRPLLEWARTRDRQPWLPPSHIRPPIIGPAWLTTTKGEMTHGYPLERKDVVMLEESKLPSGAITQASTEEEIPPAESLLAEARWAVWPHQDPDTKRAVLLAAIALEVKTPRTLLEAARGTTETVLQAIYSRAPDVPMSVVIQLNAIAEAVIGQGLKEHDGKLNKRIRALFTCRNDVAHRGVTPSLKQALDGVAAVEEVVSWLDERCAGLSPSDDPAPG